MDIEQRIEKGRHLVILGAGASKATFPDGDKNGKILPVMDDFLKQINLEHLINDIDLSTNSKNIEDIYSEIASRNDLSKTKAILEEEIYKYFDSLVLPDEITIYDLLLLSLRDKDYIFSFNWDDLLIQAYIRVKKITTNLPKMYFLHGNVGCGICPSCKSFGSINLKCPKCNMKFEKTKLLYPINDKNYSDNKFIKIQWEAFSQVLRMPGLITIYGYGAPNTDIKAIEIMKKAFIPKDGIRYYEKIEIIDIKDEKELYETWWEFIENVHEHCNIIDSFWNSSFANSPRRTVEFYTEKNFRMWFGEPTINLKNCEYNIKDISEKINPLIIDEANGIFKVI